MNTGLNKKLSWPEIVAGLVVGIAGVWWAATSSTGDAPKKVPVAQQPPHLASCNYTEMSKVNVSVFDSLQESAICNLVASRVGATPSVALLQKLLEVGFLIKRAGCPGSVEQIDTQLLDIAKARHQTDEKKIADTASTVYKISTSMKCQVTPQDLLDALESSGPAAPRLSDKGLVSVATLIRTQKQTAY